MIVGVSTFNETLKVLHLTLMLNWNSLFPKEFVFFIKFSKLSLAVARSTVLISQMIGVLMVPTIFIKVLFELSVVFFVVLAVSNV
jgi:hypothetical protein